MSTIVVVDDEESVVNLLKSALEEEGFTVHTAMDGKKALQAIKKVKPDLVLLDVQMVGHNDGFEVLSELKKNSKTASIPIVMLTGRTAPVDIEKGIRDYADKYFTKPFQVRGLIEEVKKTIALHKT